MRALTGQQPARTHGPPHGRAPGQAEPPWAAWAVLYALLVLYASTVISPAGLNFVPKDPAAAWQSFLAIGMGSLASDQRADWMGNVAMLVPLGFATAAALSRGRRRVAPALLALALCIGFVVAVKYAQLFFPPRTVNLAYIIAQSLGAAIGVAIHLAAYPLLRRAWAEITHATHRGLVWLLTAYALGVLVFMLAPFDIIVSRADMAERWHSLSSGFLALPGQGRQGHQRLIILLANVALLAPVGALLRTLRPADALARVALRGLGLLLAANLLSACFLSTTPTLAAILLRATGIVLGAAAMGWLGTQNLRVWHRYLAPLALLAVLPYLGLLALANGLAIRHWAGPDLLLNLDPRLLLPLWTHYIVSKAQAIKSVGVHLAMYAPIGAVIWSVRGSGRAQMAAAFILGFALSLVVEIARAVGPGLAPDFNNAVIGAVAAAAAVPVCRVLWAMLENVPIHHAAPRQ